MTFLILGKTFFPPAFPLWTLNIRLNEIRSARPGHCLSTPPLMCDFIRPNADVKQFYRTAVCTQIAQNPENYCVVFYPLT